MRPIRTKTSYSEPDHIDIFYIKSYLGVCNEAMRIVWRIASTSRCFSATVRFDALWMLLMSIADMSTMASSRGRTSSFFCRSMVSADAL